VAGICHDQWNSYAGVDVICPAGSFRSGSMLVLISDTCSQLCDIHLPTSMGTTNQSRISPGVAFFEINYVFESGNLSNQQNQWYVPVCCYPAGKMYEKIYFGLTN
jgi:hypothetical protein